MTNEIEAAVRTAEKQLADAKVQYENYKRLYEQWQDEVHICQRVLNRLREVAGLPAKAPTPSVIEHQPAVTEAAKPPLPLPAVGAIQSNGFDRAAVKRQVREWRIKYPLPQSYQQASQFARQAIVATLTDTPGYRSKWLAAGKLSLTSSIAGVNLELLDEAAIILDVDIEEVHDRAVRMQRDIAAYGVEGVDYLWHDLPVAPRSAP